MMRQEAAKLRSASGRKSTTGLAIRSSRKIRHPSPRTNRTNSVCTRQKGSLYQSHSCPLLSITSQLDMNQSEQPQADVIEVQRAAAQLRPLLLEVVRVVNQEVARQEAEGTHREIDKEDPAPVVVDREITAQCWADDRREQGRDAEQ